MESQQQKVKYGEPTSLKVGDTAKQASSAGLPPTVKFSQQLQQVATIIYAFLVQLPHYMGRLFNNYKQSIATFALIVVALISLKLVLAVIDSLEGIPLLVPTFELIGIGYLVWFVNRYLLKVSNRQELLREFQSLKSQLLDS